VKRPGEIAADAEIAERQVPPARGNSSQPAPCSSGHMHTLACTVCLSLVRKLCLGSIWSQSSRVLESLRTGKRRNAGSAGRTSSFSHPASNSERLPSASQPTVLCIGCAALSSRMPDQLPPMRCSKRILGPSCPVFVMLRWRCRRPCLGCSGTVARIVPEKTKLWRTPVY
jgi:hypothetical protein